MGIERLKKPVREQPFVLIPYRLYSTPKMHSKLREKIPPRQIRKKSLYRNIRFFLLLCQTMTIDVLSMVSIIAIFQSFLMAAFFALNKKKIANQQYYAHLFTPCICRDSGRHTDHKQSSFLLQQPRSSKKSFSSSGNPPF